MGKCKLDQLQVHLQVRTLTSIVHLGPTYGSGATQFSVTAVLSMKIHA